MAKFLPEFVYEEENSVSQADQLTCSLLWEKEVHIDSVYFPLLLTKITVLMSFYLRVLQSAQFSCLKTPIPSAFLQMVSFLV